MLDNLRANKGGIITYVFLFAIIVVFVVSFGPGSFDKGCKMRDRESWAAHVNGTTIPLEDYQRAYSSVLRAFQAQAGGNLPRELIDQLGLPRIAMDQVVERTLVAQEARRRGLAISDEELATTIRSLPAFQEGGVFSQDAYVRWAAGTYGSTTRFEQVLRDDLLGQRMIEGMRETVKVSDAEVKQAWAAEHDRVTLAFVRFPLAGAAAEAAKPTPAEVEAFAAKEAERIKKFHAENPARFDQPRKVHARHILVKVGEGPDAEAAAKARVEALAARIAKGEDFAKVAQQASDDANTRQRGGDLGFIAEGLVEKPFAEAAFALKQGQVSAPVRTSSGFHLIKADEVVEARKIPLEAARLDIARELLAKDRAAALARARAEAALAAVKGGKKLADLFPAEVPGKKGGPQPVKLGGTALAVSTTGPFGDGTFVPAIGPAPGLAAEALQLQAGAPVPHVIDSAEGPVVAVVERRERPDAAQYEAQKEATATRLRNRREAEVQAAWLKSLRDAATIEVNPLLAKGGAAQAE